MDAIQFLEDQHKGAKKAMEAVKAAKGSKKKELFMALKLELEGHDHLEESIFYPAVEAMPKAEGLAKADKEAHQTVEKALLKLSLLPVDEASWDKGFAVLQAELLEHIKDEETRIFVKIRALLSTSEANALGLRMEAEKERMSTTAKA